MGSRRYHCIIWDVITGPSLEVEGGLGHTAGVGAREGCTALTLSALVKHSHDSVRFGCGRFDFIHPQWIVCHWVTQIFHSYISKWWPAGWVISGEKKKKKIKTANRMSERFKCVGGCNLAKLLNLGGLHSSRLEASWPLCKLMIATTIVFLAFLLCTRSDRKQRDNYVTTESHAWGNLRRLRNPDTQKTGVSAAHE